VGLLNKIIGDFKAVKNRDPAFKNNIELFYAYPGVWALAFYRIANALYKTPTRSTSELLRFL